MYTLNQQYPPCTGLDCFLEGLWREQTISQSTGLEDCLQTQELQRTKVRNLRLGLHVPWPGCVYRQSNVS